MAKSTSKAKSSRRKWRPEEKIEIIRDHFNSSRFVDTCEKHRIHPNLLGNWWKTVVEAGVEALSGDGRRLNKKREKTISRYEDELARKNRIIAELSAEVLDLKKPFGEI